MSETITRPGAREHNRKAAAMWSLGGAAYDEISRGISSAIEHCVERLAPEPGARILDVATGTGWTARRVAARGAEVVGVDIAEGLLEPARELARAANMTIDYRLGDAEALPFDDDEFDGVISTFGVMFAPDQESAVSELVRVTRPGGRIAVAAWPTDSQAVALRKVVAPFAPPPPATPPPSPFNWGDRAWLAETLGRDVDLGFEDGVTVHRLAHAEAAWRVYEAGFGPVRAVAESLDADRRSALRAAFVEWCGGFADGLGIALPFAYLVSAGTKV